uniref:GAGE domain-containing protein n=1 Tax=Phocoena sinus TaxID=42100 RepID=A0A8C9CYT4_PHOSS
PWLSYCWWEREGVRNMNGHVRRRSKSAGRRESSQVVGPLVAQQPGDKPPQLEELPSENQDTISAQDIEGEGAPVAQGPAMEADQQELALLKTDEPGDGPDVKEEILPSLEPIKMPEVGEGQSR